MTNVGCWLRNSLVYCASPIACTSKGKCQFPPKEIQCIDSVKAKKALECVESLTKQMRITAANEAWDDGWEAIHHTLKLFGFPT